jgi:uncharacterized protein (DUF924 family)
MALAVSSGLSPRPLPASACSPCDVIDFWFDSKLDVAALKTLWFGNSPESDAVVTARFGLLVSQALSGELCCWQEVSHEATVAAIIVLDQFTRMVFRNKAQAFAGDGLALELAKALLLDKSLYDQMPLAHRIFALMPLQHSEDVHDQAEAVRLTTQLVEASVGTPLGEFLPVFLKVTLAHHAVVCNLGRFPHRNAVLCRENSVAEVKYLHLLRPNTNPAELLPWMVEHRACLGTWGQSSAKVTDEELQQQQQSLRRSGANGCLTIVKARHLDYIMPRYRSNL